MSDATSGSAPARADEPWESLGVDLFRVPVPGGYLYVHIHEAESGEGYTQRPCAAFVPAAPQLVLLETEDADHKPVPLLVEPARVASIKRYGAGGSWLAISHGDTYFVRGEPLEVAAKLGLSVAP